MCGRVRASVCVHARVRCEREDTAGRRAATPACSTAACVAQPGTPCATMGQGCPGQLTRPRLPRTWVPVHARRAPWRLQVHARRAPWRLQVHAQRAVLGRRRPGPRRPRPPVRLLRARPTWPSPPWRAGRQVRRERVPLGRHLPARPAVGAAGAVRGALRGARRLPLRSLLRAVPHAATRHPRRPPGGRWGARRALRPSHAPPARPGVQPRAASARARAWKGIFWCMCEGTSAVSAPSRRHARHCPHACAGALANGCQAPNHPPGGSLGPHDARRAPHGTHLEHTRDAPFLQPPRGRPYVRCELRFPPPPPTKRAGCSPPGRGWRPPVRPPRRRAARRARSRSEVL